MSRCLVLRFLIGSCLVLALSACGGSGEELCAANNQTFSVDFEEPVYNATLGSNTSIETKIFPESCRDFMTVTLRNGTLPQGLTIEGGNLKGAPSEAGEFKVQLAISGVSGYQAQSFAPSVAPRSREVTLFVR
ncbi:MAG: hypothetical protein Q8Q84_03110 [Hydrogenophaga sp.]|jgi:hypothetical protein|nr:hypothetical protein [Hydrogenophaga sp.]MDP3922346.1 hypothetical protein [Hydrogenophaga sp.]